MCGIFGLVYNKDSLIDLKEASKMINNLFSLSESRGKEASGFAMRHGDKIEIFKSPEPATELIKKPCYKKCFKENNGNLSQFLFIGHSRLVTNGIQLENSNNQPVVKDNVVGIHNGIVCNVDKLWEEYSELERKMEVDTEIILSLFQKFVKTNGSFRQAITNVFKKIEGSASIGLTPDYSDILLLATNTGSIYYTDSLDGNIFIFASEEFILQKAFRNSGVTEKFGDIFQLLPGEALEVNLNDSSYEKFLFNAIEAQPEKNINFSEHSEIFINNDRPISNSYNILLMNNHITKENRAKGNDIWEKLYNRKPLMRCSRCALPETMTFIDFDDNGVCNYCREHKKFEVKGVDSLKKEMAPYIKNYFDRDCLVGISGGRDSCYGLHYIKHELGLNPIAFTFDWAVVTDLSRRNISRMCGKLGVEHVIFSADINWKRNNIRRNINAWLNKPNLGMVPLLMAGDKEMHKFASKMIKQTGLELLLWCCGHNYEHTPFKIGFAGISPLANTFFHWLSVKSKIKYFIFFFRQFMLNPGYLNPSVFDTFMAGIWQFILPLPKSAFLLYEYIPWNEHVVNDILINEYNWEIAPDTTTTWRIGDGTAAFYNYIYMTVAGITEHDTFRSSQIREGALTREKGFELIKEDNKPRFETIEWYANIIGFDVNKAIEIINSIPKHYV